MPAAERSGPIATLRALLVAFVLGASMTNPTFALRMGAVMCGLVVVSAVGAWRPRGLDVAMLGLAGLAFLSRDWTLSPIDTDLISTNYLGFAAMFLAIRVAVVNARTLRLVAYGFVVGCVYAAYQVITVSGRALLRFEFDTTASRVDLDVASGASANYLAYGFAACVAVLVMLWGVRPFSKKGWILALATVTLMWLGIVAAGTRGALVAAGLTAGWLLVQRWFPGRFLGALGGAYVVTSVLLAAGELDRFLAARVERSDRETGTLNGRLDVWPIAREQFAEHPLVGVGAGAFRSLNSWNIPAHNAILDIATGLGIAGLALVAIIFYRAFVTDSATAERNQRVLVVGSAVLATAPALTTGYWIESPTFWGFLALISVLGRASSTGSGGNEAEMDHPARASA